MDKWQNTISQRTIRPAHPGEVLVDILEDSGVDETEFAGILGIPQHDLNQVIQGSQPVTVDMAIRLGKALGNGPQLWLTLQQKVDIWDALRINQSEYDRVQVIFN
jgi:addiction module HigA family antidote